MMTKNDILNALCGRIDDANILPAYMPNIKADAILTAATTYMEVKFAAVRTQWSGLNVTDIVQEIGILQVVIVVPDGTGTTAVGKYANDIKLLFTRDPVLILTVFSGRLGSMYRWLFRPPDDRPVGGGKIVIGAVDVKEGFNFDGEYRVPVHIPYSANHK